MASGVTAQELKDQLLYGLISQIPLLQSWGGIDDALTAAIEEAEGFVERELGTRFAVTQFRSYMAAAAEPVPPTPGPGQDAVEYEPPYQWPGYTPGDGYPRIRTRVRPLLEVTALKLNLPGSIVAPYTVPLGWLRVDRTIHEVMVAPSAGTVPFGLAQARWWTGLRLPQSALLEYRAGLGADGLKKWPQVLRLVKLHAAIAFLPTAGLILNPTVSTSESADGLSQSRSNGYVFKDLEDRLRSEAEALMLSMRNVWEGPGLFVL
jgi:hypothetical protein